jgi:uncharacterized membrane protein YgcG
MIKTLFLLLVLSLPSRSDYINDIGNLLAEKQVVSLNKKLKAIKKQTNLNFVILIVADLESRSMYQLVEQVSEEWAIDDLSILILYEANQRLVEIKLGSKVKKHLDAEQIDLITKRYARTLFEDDQLYLSIEKTVNKITVTYLRNKEDSSNDRKSKVTAAILIAFFIIIIWRIIRAAKPYYDPKIRKWREDTDRKKTFGQ